MRERQCLSLFPMLYASEVTVENSVSVIQYLDDLLCS